MKKLVIIILIVSMVFAGCANITDGNNEVQESDIDYAEFFTEEIHKIEISISEENFNEILKNPTEEEFYSANVTLDGESVENVGFRTKGNSTLRDVALSDSERYSFKIKVDEYEDDQKLLGLDEFVINNMYSDVSYLREYLSYKALENSGEIVPLSSFVNVYINDELYGFYLLVESIDDSFLERNFGDNDGNLYRADMGTTLELSDGKYIENVDQKNGKDESKEDLFLLIENLNEMEAKEKGNIESILDIDSLLRYIAFNTLLENYDSLSGKHVQNYYLYNNEGIFIIIPWDLNMSFGGFGGSEMSTIDIDEPVYGVEISSLPLIENILEVEEYKERYYEILNDYINYFENFESKVTELADLIRPYVEADPSKFYTMEAFEKSIVYDENGSIESNAVGGDENRDLPPMGNNERPINVEGNDRSKENIEIKSDDNRGLPPNDMRMNQNKPMNINDVSIVNILVGRIENIKSQLEDK